SLISQGTPMKVAWGAGILLKPCERLRIGAAFHSHVDFEYTGPATFGQIPTGNAQLDAIVASRIPFGAAGSPAATTIQFPSLSMFGISYDVTPNITLNADGNYTTWKVFDKTVIKIQGLADTVLQHDYHDTWTVRGGIQYKPDPTNGNTWIAGGFIYDQTPQP